MQVEALPLSVIFVAVQRYICEKLMLNIRIGPAVVLEFFNELTALPTNPVTYDTPGMGAITGGNPKSQILYKTPFSEKFSCLFSKI